MAQEPPVEPIVDKKANNVGKSLGNVPLHVFEKIVRRMDPHSIFEVSLISEPFLDKVTAFKYVAEYANWTVHPITKTLEIGMNNDIKLTFHIQHRPCRSNFDKLNANGKFGSISREEEKRDCVKYYFIRDYDQMGLFKEITEHVLSLFKVKKFRCYLYTDTALQELFMWNYTKTFFDFGVSVEETNAEQMTYLLENGKFTNLHLLTNVPNFNFPKQISTTNLAINNVKSLGVNNILDYGCPKIEVGEIEYGEFNTILKNWLAKENDSIESLNGTLRPPVSELFDGIKTRPTVFDIADYRLRVQVFNPENAVDIQRSTDGRIATIFVCERRFQIMTWHPKHFKYCSRSTKTRFGIIKN
ncbi:hypothetical protein CAEBREN_14350 [Caenorhabditis brenneri]|uniref:F-box domain-containing protein n=1 Tax=Caenorhabditis brenneri TaxID=135651 RepID=G0MGS3_CAEBE|nr:hypothetical protein CAEBREN_14350 [Caenorhabditis brenneri]